MTTPDDIDALAGEYVLGTLDAADRAAVAARRQREPALETAIRDWEARLAPLQGLARAVAPPSDLYAQIERRLDGGARSATGAHTIVDLAGLQRRLTTWRRVAMTASALAASLLVFVGLRETVYREPPVPQQFVGVFQKDDVLPQFYLTIDLKSRELTIRPVDAQRQAGKTYQLWIASDRLGPAPRSLGLVDEALAPTRKSLTDFDPALLERATFGVSIEATGGSTTGRPSPGALHTKLLPVAN